MDEIARLAAAERAELFRAAALRRRLANAIIEKDFWVCWTLKQLFSLPDAPSGLLFKGGTSLSKVFGLIERFSEDIDISLDRASLGFGDENDPMRAPTSKNRNAGIEALNDACRLAIRDRLVPMLHRAFTASLGPDGGNRWRLELAEDDPDGQTLLFHYPVGGTANDIRGGAYVRPNVRIEIGARSDQWPAVDGNVVPYVAEVFPAQFKASAGRVRVLAAERTFWEKATILHMWHHADPGRLLRDRQSRHYYDLVRIAASDVGEAAIADIELLQAVATHKSIFFAAAWARYDLAKPGTLRLVPPAGRMRELQDDYELMRSMIYGDVPAFATVMADLARLEARINSSHAGEQSA